MLKIFALSEILRKRKTSAALFLQVEAGAPTGQWLLNNLEGCVWGGGVAIGKREQLHGRNNL